VAALVSLTVSMVLLPFSSEKAEDALTSKSWAAPVWRQSEAAMKPATAVPADYAS
jgi:hypothetical protein